MSFRENGYSITRGGYTFTCGWNISQEFKIGEELHSTLSSLQYSMPRVVYKERTIHVDIGEILELVKKGEKAGIELVKNILKSLEIPESLVEELAKVIYNIVRENVRDILRREGLEEDYVDMFTIYVLYLVEKTWSGTEY